MAYEVPRSVVEAFYAAYATRNVEKIAGYIHDDVTWTISGPVDLLPYCGTHRGKAEILDLIGRQVPQLLQPVSFVAEAVLVQGDRAAMLSRKTARRAEDGHSIGYRVANFMRFLDGKVVENVTLIDTFDAVEQVLGHALGLPGGAPGSDDALVAV
jgi:ketosteroid isomerase-like protein